jgi:RNA polymerase sigma-70 factor (ECF subfamily)
MPNAEELFARHHRDVLGYLAHMTGRLDEAEDLAQEVFVRVVRSLQNGGSIGHERGWVFSIARNLLADRHRERRRLPSQAEDFEPAIQAAQGITYDLRESLRRIPLDDREIFLLREIAGFTYREIAEACHCTVEGVRARLYRTRVTLRSLMNPTACGRHTGK